MIDIVALTKYYESHKVLDIPSLQICEGESVGLVGNNGAGKTTLFRLILDLILPSSGKILVDNQEVKGRDEWKQVVGSFLNESQLIDFLTVGEYFKFLASLHKMNAEDLTAFEGEMKELWGDEVSLSSGKLIREYSSGNKKKIGIAAALFGNPHLVILDEPFTALDPTSQFRLKSLLKEKTRNGGLTTFISSHDLNHITEVSRRIILLENGMVRKDLNCTPDTLNDLESYFSHSKPASPSETVA